MQQIYLESYFKSGYRRLMNYISNIAHMSEEDRKIIKDRLKIIEFFEEFGLKATKRAFAVGRSAVFDWKHRLKDSGMRLSSLAPKSRRPKNFRESSIDPLVKEFIRQYRSNHPGVDKTTIKSPLDAYCKVLVIKSVSESTIGRIIKELKEKNLLPQTNSKITINGRTGRLKTQHQRAGQKKFRRNGYIPRLPGDLLQIDTIEIFIDGLKRYVVTAYDIVTAFSFAYAYKSASSFNARDFMQKLLSVAPFAIKRIQTDNGSEFEKYFREFIQKQGIIHFHNYPHHPQSNCYIENFNGVIQRQFINWHTQTLADDIAKFNQDLMDYLVWYNTEKAHRRLGKVPPLKYYLDTFIKQPQQSDMLWTLALA